MEEKQSQGARDRDEVREYVREYYRRAIKEKRCCVGEDDSAQIEAAGIKMLERAGYSQEELAALPQEVLAEFMGSGNPTAFAQIERGQTVLDIGSGAGLDCFMAALKTGPEGKVIGLDMTAEMIERSRLNAVRIGLKNVEFRQGYMEEMPIEDASVDFAISNCVINLSPDKEKVFAEIHRVLKEGGKMVISDILADDLPESVQKSIYGWNSCISGARSETVYIDMIKRAGFKKANVLKRKVYCEEEIKSAFSSEELAKEILAAHGSTAEDLAALLSGKIASATICAVK